jgi:hypothetical protein
VLIALLGLAMLIAVFLATRNSQNESVTPPTTPAKAAPPKSGTDKPARPETRQSQAPKPDSKPAARKPKPADGVPPEVQAAADALAKDQVVVFFFHKPGAADDTGARIAVRSVEHMKRVKVIKADLADVGAFRPMLSQLEISQVPATAIVRPGKQAVLLQGFVDAGTLRQNVADALR